MNPRKSPGPAARPPVEDDELTEEIRGLRDEVRVLQESIDEFREALEHAVRNLPDRLPPPTRIWSLPSDPTASDFGERINAIPQEQMEALRASLQKPIPEDVPLPEQSGKQRSLF